MGGRYHLHPNNPRVVVFSSDNGSLQPADLGLVAVGEPARCGSAASLEPGTNPAGLSTRSHSSLGSRIAVCLRTISATTTALWIFSEHESARQLLRQCGDGSVLEHAQA